MRDRFVWVGCFVYAALFTWLGWLKYLAHRNLVDFGIFSQTVSSAFQCFCNPIEGSHWAYHFSPFLYAVAAVVVLARSPLTLIALQAIAGALVAPAVYGMVFRARGDVVTARLAALVVWLYPALAGLTFGDFHENGFAPFAVAWMLYAFDSGRMLWALFFAAAALAVKEDQAIFLAIGGALAWWRFRGTVPGRVALAIGFAGAFVAIEFFTKIQPHAAQADLVLRSANAWKPDRFYAWSAFDVRQLWPGGIAARLGFVVLAFLPLLFLPFRSRAMWLAAAPLAEVLLSRMPTTFTLGTHYAGAWIGWVLAAFAFAIRRLDAGRARKILIVCAALCVLELAVANPMHPGLNLRPIESRDVTLDRFLATLPPGMSVATQEEAYTHLALFDSYARLLPESADVETDACFVLIDREFPDSPRLQEYGSALNALVNLGRYVLVDRVDGIELYRNTGMCR